MSKPTLYKTLEEAKEAVRAKLKDDGIRIVTEQEIESKSAQRNPGLIFVINTNGTLGSNGHSLGVWFFQVGEAWTRSAIVDAREMFQ